MKIKFAFILPSALFTAACSTTAPEQSQNTGRIYLPVGAAAPTQDMIDSGDTRQELKGFAVVTDPNQPHEDDIKQANGTIDLLDDWRSRDVTADISGNFETHAPDGFQFYQPSNCTFLFCRYELRQVATGTNGNKLIRRDDFYEQTYDYVMPFTYEIQGGEYYANGFVGVPTYEDDIVAPEARYVGEAKISMFDYGDGHADPFTRSHRAIIKANFETATMDVFIPEIDHDFTTAPMGTPFQYYQVTGIDINGAVFSGGQPLAKDGNGTKVYPVGVNSEFSSAGMFYGIDRDRERPDEVAGVFNDIGDTTALQIEFIAD